MHAVFTDRQLADLGDKIIKLSYMHAFSGWEFRLETRKFDVSQNLKSQNYPFFLKFLMCPKTCSPEK